MTRMVRTDIGRGPGGADGAPGPPGADGAPGAPGGSDAAFAAWIANNASATYAAGVAAFGSLVNISSAPGVDPTGATDCGMEFQAALDAVAAFGGCAYAVGDFDFDTTTITIESDVWFPPTTTFHYSGTGAAVQLGSGVSEELLRHKRIVLPTIINDGKVGLGWAAGRIGVKAVNTQECDITVPETQGFESNYYAYGLGGGNAYNVVRLAHLNNGKRNLVIGAGTDGWCNSNTYILGSLSHNSGEGTNVAGVRQILIETGTTHLVNGNLFVGGSVEGDVAEYELDCDGYENEFVGIRWENTGGGKVIWRANADRNEIKGGYGAHLIVETHVAGSTLNRIWSTGTTHLNGASDSATFVFENRAGADNATDVVMDPGAREDGSDPATDYRVHRSANATNFKRASDAHPRMKDDHDNGRRYFGPGTGAPTGYIGQFGSGQGQIGVFNADLVFSPHNTKDLGWDDQRPRDVYVGRRLYTPASAAGQAGANFPHGTAPAAPVNGDVWTTTAGLYCRVNGVTMGPFSANDTDANLKNRANHTGTQTSSTISDFQEAAQDAIAALLASGTQVSLSYNDAGNSLTISATGADAEAMRDAVGAAMVGVGLIAVTVNDALDTITISTTATANDTDANLKNRANHTGTQAAGTITGLAAVATSGAKGDVGLGNVDNTADTAKPVSTAQQTALDLKVNALRTISTKIADHQLVLADLRTLIRMNLGSAINLTIPTNATLALPVGFEVDVQNVGAGTLTLVTTGLTVNKDPIGSKVVTGKAVTLIKTATDTWSVIGGLSA